MAKAAVALKKPAAAPTKPVALAKGKPAASKAVATKPAAKPAAKAPAKPAKPYENGEIVVFKGYAPPTNEAAKPVPADTKGKLFTPEQELAVVGERQDNGATFISVVAVGDYHRFIENPDYEGEDAVQGEEVMPSEIKRTNKKVEAPYELVAVGNMETILAEDSDPLNVAKALYSKASESFFYLGGVLAQLIKGRGADGEPVFASYEKEDGTTYGKDGLEDFLLDNFGEAFGGVRKARYYVSIYESFAALDDPDKLVAEMAKVGWWKVALMANYVTNENVTELLETAGGQNEKEFKETLKTQYTSEGSTPQGKAATRATVKKTTFGPYKLYEDQASGVEMILNAAAKQIGVQDPNLLFEYIITEWASEHLGDVAEKAKAKVNQATAKLKKSGAKLPGDHPAAEKEAPKEAAKPAAKPAATAKPLAKPAKK